MFVVIVASDSIAEAGSVPTNESTYRSDQSPLDRAYLYSWDVKAFLHRSGMEQVDNFTRLVLVHRVLVLVLVLVASVLVLVLVLVSEVLVLVLVLQPTVLETPLKFPAKCCQ